MINKELTFEEFCEMMFIEENELTLTDKQMLYDQFLHSDILEEF